MRLGDFEFNLRELAGSMGDFGTLFPLAIGYIAVCGMDPAGLLVMMGLANIATGMVYRLPMPIEPMKVLAVMAIAQVWSPAMIYASAFAMGIIWVFIALTGAMRIMTRITPRSVVRGIQVSLGILLGLQSLKMIHPQWLLGALSIAVVLLFRKSRYFPAALLLMAMGVGIMAFKGDFSGVKGIGLALPGVSLFPPGHVWESLVRAGFAQVPLTVTNAVIATSALISQYWPDKPVSEHKLALNMGIMNLTVPFFGGMPLCHGAGGLAAQYYFGARTGGANIIEGLIEIFMGIFLAGSIATLLAVFPEAIIGAMMLMVGIEMVKFARDLSGWPHIAPAAATVIVSVGTNMALGFAAGLAVHHMHRFFSERKKVN
ncbi:MAG: putative sulfate/molybdate transporter [Proteobacteria bacterium]|nr:putative sulfate/molybdate transporter [Pseudomonadota bacterium]